MRNYGWLIMLVGVLLIVIFGRSLVWKNPAQRTAEELAFENVRLEAEISVLRSAPEISTAGDYTYLTARVYASYPLSSRNLLTLAAGSRDGVRAGAPVTLGRSILVGEVVEVYTRSSVMRTIFDAEWSSSVKIGAKGADALLQGGTLPRLTMIEKGASLGEGDAAISASHAYPYGLRIGEVRRIRDITEGTFREAELATPYAVRDLDAVEIILDFPDSHQ